MIVNYFFSEQAIKTKLLEITALKGVHFWDDAYKSFEIFQKPCPCAYIIFAGDKIGDNSGGGQSHIIRQEWVVALAVKSFADTVGIKAREEAGTIMLEILDKMSGFKPHDFADNFKRIQGDPVIYLSSGIMILPTNWQTMFVLGKKR
jgi:hypothetical protein